MAFKLCKSWFFILSSAAFVSLITQAVAVYTHGLAGFFIILSLAIFAGLFENILPKALRNIHIGINNNKALVFLLIWYFLGLLFNSLINGEGFSDWRLMMGPIVFLLGMFFVFTFIHDNSCYRFFQLALLVALGIQSYFSVRIMYSDIGIAREMVGELSSAWIYGEQGGFALIAMIFPILVWRSMKESGIIKIILLVSCVIIFIAFSISNFSTPFALSMINALFIGVFVLVFPFTKYNSSRRIFVGVLFLSTVLIVYFFTQDNPLLLHFHERFINLIQDPRSGGYGEYSALAGSRWLLADISLQSFLDNPLFGMEGGNIRHSQFVGNHSSFFDSLGGYGLLGGGGAFCGIMLFLLFKAIIRFRKERDWETLLGLISVISLLIGGIVNPYWEGWQPTYVLLMARPLLRTTACSRMY